MNLEQEIQRVEPYADSFHIDVADGRYAPGLLFFPDMVAAIRDTTDRPIEVHLITQEPQRWVNPFVEAGADTIIFYPDTMNDPLEMIETIRSLSLNVGVSLAISHPVSLIEDYINRVDLEQFI